MILLGKCKKDFFEWGKDKGINNFYAKDYSLNLAKLISYSIIQEFFRDKFKYYSYVEIFDDDTFDYTIISDSFKEETDFKDEGSETYLIAIEKCILTMQKTAYEKHI